LYYFVFFNVKPEIELVTTSPVESNDETRYKVTVEMRKHGWGSNPRIGWKIPCVALAWTDFSHFAGQFSLSRLHKYQLQLGVEMGTLNVSGR
jgi:hypothetical protein